MIKLQFRQNFSYRLISRYTATLLKLIELTDMTQSIIVNRKTTDHTTQTIQEFIH